LTVSVHQPQYAPWLGYFDKMIQSDVFVLLDSVQFKKNEFQNRNKIKTSQGWQWISVPVRYRFPQLIREVTINEDVNWRYKHRVACSRIHTSSTYAVDPFQSLRFLHPPARPGTPVSRRA